MLSYLGLRVAEVSQGMANTALDRKIGAVLIVDRPVDRKDSLGTTAGQSKF